METILSLIDIQYIISSLIAFITSGGIFSILYFKLDKKLKQAEVKRAELENVSATIIQWQELYHESEEERKELQQKYMSEITSKQELFDIISQEKQEKEDLKRQNEELKWHKCTRNGCTRRQPPRDYTTTTTE